MAINNNKEVTRGDTAMFSVTLYDQEGTEYIPTTGEIVRFYLLKKGCDDLDDALLVKDIPIDTMQLELTPSETDIATGTYPYKVRLIDQLGHEWTAIKAQLKIIC